MRVAIYVSQHSASRIKPPTPDSKARSKDLEVVNLLTLTAAQEWRLSALVVDVGPEILLEGLGRSLGLLDSLVDFSLSLLVEFL